MEKLFADRNDILIYTTKSSSDYAQSGDPFKQALDNKPVIMPLLQRHPRPDEPQWKIPISEWPNTIRRVVGNQEPFRQVADDYGQTSADPGNNSVQ